MIGQVTEYEEPIDFLKLFFNKEFPITDKIIIHQPTMQDIIDYKYGEGMFTFVLHVFTGNTTYFKVMLWDNGIDWNEITDFEMFSSFVVGLPVEQTRILFGDLDFTNFKKLVKRKIEKEIVDDEEIEKEVEDLILYDPVNDIEINELTYFRMRFYLRHMFNFFPDVEVGIKGKRMKREIIEYDRKKAARNSSSSFYLPLISMCLNHPGFKYKSNELREIGIVEFLDSVTRLILYEHSNATLKGMTSGFVDGSKISPDSYDFCKDIYSKRRSESAFEKVKQFDKSVKEAEKQSREDSN